MKQIDYRYIIIFIIISVTVSICIKLALNTPPPKSPAITINKKIIDKNVFNSMFSKRSAYQNMDSFIDSVIIKELLIQEAVKAGIPEEESFRKSIKEYYELSLIKMLMDRKYASIRPDIDEALIDRYIELTGATIYLTLIKSPDEPETHLENTMVHEPLTVLFDDLSTDIRFSILSLATGEKTRPFYSEMEKTYSIIRLERVEMPQPKPRQHLDRDTIKALLAEHKKEIILSDWVTGLKQNAAINISTLVDNDSDDSPP